MKKSDIPSPFVTKSSRIAWSSPWFQVRQDQIQLPDGSPAVYNIVQHDGAVWVIPVTDEGEIVLVYSYRYTVDDWCWEIPAGGIKPGLSMEQSVEAELLEEIGGVARHLEYAGCFYTSNGISNEVAHVYVASGVTLGETNHEPAEVIEVYPMPIREVLAMARANRISDGPSALALLLNEKRLLELAAV